VPVNQAEIISDDEVDATNRMPGVGSTLRTTLCERTNVLRLCIVNEFFYPDSTGGTGTILSSLARDLHDTYGIEIDVVTTVHLYRDEKARLPRYENWDGINIYRLPTPRASKTSIRKRLFANALYGAAALFQLLRHRRYDLILVGTAPPTVAYTAYLYKRLNGTPYNYIVYDLMPDVAIAMHVMNNEGRVARLLKRWQRAWLHSAERTIVLGRCMRDYLIKQYNVHPEKIEIVPIGADPEEIVPLERDTCFRQIHELGGFIAMYGGNFGRHHNFDTVLNAAKQLLTQRNDITIVLIGAGAQKQHIEERIAAERLTNVKLFLMVPQKEYAQILPSADVALVVLEPGMEGLCVPSKFYGILAAGRATIALMSPESEVALVIEEEDCGVQLDQGDSAKLAETLAFLADHPARVEEMGRNARRALLRAYSSRHIADAYYRSFLAATGQEDVAVVTEEIATEDLTVRR
jgi:colanic acid biosynthesis glycosyl transferase WcaI